jgi:DNA processing protein
MTAREAYIALNRTGQIGPVGVRALREALGSVEAVFEADAADLMRVNGIGRETARAIIEERQEQRWQAELERADREGLRLITPADADYPPSLLEIYDPPLALYVRGTLQSGDRQALAVVGTRHPTHYGRDCARRLAGLLAQVGYTVVSGLAEGIDTCAHEAALAARGRTWAVLGSAHDCLYPASNRELADKIADQGAVFSEFPFGRKPDRTTFPMRNRIVSGMSMGTLVVEAGLKSGALITARQALEQGRLVLAVPGRIDSPVSKGPNSLIKNGAKLVETVDDILGEFEFLFPPSAMARASAQTAPRPPLSEEETRVLTALADGDCDVDELIRAAGLDARSVGPLLIGLEMKRMIRMLPGRRVERMGTWSEPEA